jgi:outer membrane lipoprotein-sorting protein
MPYIHTMLKNRFIPTLGIAALLPLAALAQGPPAAAPAPAPASGAPAAAEPPTEAEKTIDQAAAKIAALKSVTADISQTVDLLDQKFTVKGRFLRAPSHRIYLRLTVSGLPDATGTLLQVCDGQTLWDYSQILDSQSYRKILVGQIFEKLTSPDLEDELRKQIVAQLGFAGPEQLLVGLRKLVRFNQIAAGKYEGKDVWVIAGEWKSRDGLIPGNQQAVSATMLLPPYIPSLVKIYLGKADGWPYKLEFVGQKPSVMTDNRQKGPDGRLLGSKGSVQEIHPTRIDLVYGNVQFNPELKIEEFVFQPPAGAQVVDATASLVAGLDQAIQLKAAQKKAEAARNDVPALPQAIDIPRSGAIPAADPVPTPGNPAR